MSGLVFLRATGYYSMQGFSGFAKRRLETGGGFLIIVA